VIYANKLFIIVTWLLSCIFFKDQVGLLNLSIAFRAVKDNENSELGVEHWRKEAEYHPAKDFRFHRILEQKQNLHKTTLLACEVYFSFYCKVPFSASLDQLRFNSEDLRNR
jgi:hypothetical protein